MAASHQPEPPSGETSPVARAGRARYRIGRYWVTGHLGKGGMGRVYRAFDEALDREVAIKTLTGEGTLDPESRQRFEREARAAAKLQHPNIVTVFELGEDRGSPFIAMELLPGIDLEALLRSGEPLLLAEKLDIVAQVCRGLAYAHEHGVVHRDVKPSNIRLLDNGTAKIMDFGIAKLAGGSGLTKSGMMVGTVHYMSPEQVRGRGLDGRSDVFSLGVILYELLAGQKPFRGEAATDILFKIVHEPPLPIDPEGAAAADLSPRLRETVAQALAKDPEQRFPSAAAMADAIAAVREEHSRWKPALMVPTEKVNGARRLLKEGRIEESLETLRELVETTPTSLEVRRALRAATREMQSRARPPQPGSEEFPELLAADQVAPTSRPEETLLQERTVTTAIPPTRVRPEEPAAPPFGRAGRRPWLPLFAGLGIAAVLGFGLAFLRGPAAPAAQSPSPESRQAPSPSPSLAARTEPLTPTMVKVPVFTSPAGALVALDGAKVAGTTPLDVTLDPTAGHRLALSLDGHLGQELRLEAGKPPGEVRVRLEPVGQLLPVTVSSVYPVDVTWKGKALARAQVSPTVQLPPGRQTLALTSAAYFLRMDLVVNVVPGGESVVEAPGLGKISVRANPDNCQVFIDGSFADYPPILDKSVAAGSHVVSFKWRDGGKAEETVAVVPGKVAFVTGRKE